MTNITRRSDSREYVYVCTNPMCRAEQTYTTFVGVSVPRIVNCYRCGAGRGIPLDQMWAMKKGAVLAEGVPSLHEVPAQGQRPS